MADLTAEHRDRANGEDALVLAEVAFASAWNVRGNLAHAPFAGTAERLFGVSLPARPNTGAHASGIAVWGLGPRAWLFIAAAPRLDFDDARVALNAAGGALFDVSASQVAWSVTGASAARVLNRGCPLDLDLGAFPAGSCAQSVLGHVSALFHRPDESPRFIVMAARSYAADVRDHLSAAARSDGYRIGARSEFPPS